MSKILFSPVGGTDPLSNDNYQDGAIVHIVRNYRPERIVLFLSQEMLRFHKEDNRYIKSLYLLYREFLKQEDPEQLEKLTENALKPQQQFPLENASLELYQIGNMKVETIEREGLSEVQDFNTFYREFPRWIHYSMKELGEEETLLLNVSSGTPSMKGCLLSMQLLQDIHCKVIQVSTPVRRMNEHRHSGFVLEEAWENNIDNLEGFTNRCTEVLVPDFTYMIQENQIKRLIQEYDYKGALALAKSLPKERTEEYLSFLKMALQRSLLDMDSVESFIKHNRGKFQFPVKKAGGKEGEKSCLVFEYCLQMQLKLARGDFDGFIRSLTPVIWDLFFQIIEKDLGLPISKYIENVYSDTKVKYWKLDGLQQQTDENEKKIYTVLLTKMNFQDPNKRMTVYSPHFLALIQAYHSLDLVKNTAGDLRTVEENLRNMVAHQMIPVTEKIILEKTGFTPKIIMEKLKDLYSRAYFPCTEEQWNSYEMMNKDLIKVISQKNR